jgi:hypothetical protein
MGRFGEGNFGAEFVNGGLVENFGGGHFVAVTTHIDASPAAN